MNDNNDAIIMTMMLSQLEQFHNQPATNHSNNNDAIYYDNI